MEERPAHRKPIGESGPVRITHAPDGETKIEWEKIEYPAEKAPQELVVASAFVNILSAEQKTHWQLVPLKENDFDLEIRAPKEERYLELQEIVIPGKKRGSPYASGEKTINAGKFAKTIIDKIASKAIRYSRSATKPLDLLVYITHWRFLPNQAVLQLVAHELDGGVIHSLASISLHGTTNRLVRS